MREHERSGAALGLPSAILVLFLAVPLAALVWRAVGEGAGLTDASVTTLRQALLLSLGTSLISLAIIVVLGVPLAYLLARRRFPGVRLVDTLVDLPIVLPARRGGTRPADGLWPARHRRPMAG